MKQSILSLALASSALTVFPMITKADAPRVVADIAPVHSLVSMVMQGIGAPDLIVPQNSSPHGFSMRVSQASALENAGLVVWVGHDLTPWLEGPLETLSGDAKVVELMDVSGLTTLAFRTEHDHDHGEHGHGEHKDEDHASHDHGDHGHDDHKDEDHAGHDHGDHDHGAHKEDDHAGHDHGAHKDEDHAGHDHDAHKEDDHAGHDHDDHKAEDPHAGHDHSGQDPHIWLDPANAQVMLTAIAQALSEIDPANAETYAANAQSSAAQIQALDAELAATLAPVQGKPFMVLHDAYQYFDAYFDLSYEGAILDVSGASPGPAGLAATRAHLAEHGVACVLTEPQLNTSLVETVIEGQDVTLAQVDPLGADLEPGPQLYPQMMRALAAGIAGCFKS